MSSFRMTHLFILLFTLNGKKNICVYFKAIFYFKSLIFNQIIIGYQLACVNMWDADLTDPSVVLCTGKDLEKF